MFGNKPKEAIKLLKSGVSKEEIFRKTGMTIGVQNASFEIKEGEIFVIMGLSGSGKSTLVRLLNRLIEPTSGEIFINNTEITNANDDELLQIRREQISMVFQSFALMPHMNIMDNAAFGLELNGVDKKVRYKKAQIALEQVGLGDYTESYPDELSGGMQQRVGLARALANDPEIMLMDEAFSALDPLIRTEMQDELLKLQEEQKRTIVFISHDLDEAIRIGDRIAVMQGGEIIQIGTPEEIINNPANEYIKSFFKGVDVTGIFTAKHIAKKSNVTIIKKEGSGIHTAMQLIRDYDRDFGLVLGKGSKYEGCVSLSSLKKAEKSGKTLQECIDEKITIEEDTPISEFLSIVAKAQYPVAVVDKNGKYLGTISRATLLEALDYEGGEIDG